MKKFSSLFLLMCGLLVTAQNPNPSTVIDAQINQLMESKYLPGVSTVIVKDGEVVWMNSYGYANTDSKAKYTNTTSQMLASVSKTFTGMALLQLAEAGKFNLDDPINNYISSAINVPGHENTPITFKMLLTHTASINDSAVMDNFYNWSGDPTISIKDCVEGYFLAGGAYYNASENFLTDQPGTGFKYSNMGTTLEAYLVEVISEMSFNDFCKEYIFDKLCMTNTHWYFEEYSDVSQLANPHDNVNSTYTVVPHYGFADFPNGGLKSNVTDLANLMIAILGNGIINDNRFLKAETVDAMFTGQIPNIDQGDMGLQFYQEEFNVNQQSIPLWGHGGEEKGVKTEMYFDHQENMGIAVLGNSRNSVKEIFELLYNYGLTLQAKGGENKPTCGLSLSTGQSELSKTNFDMFPNPTRDHITFGFEGATVRNIEIIEMSGRTVRSYMNSDASFTIDLSFLSNGMYFYTIIEDGLVVKSGKIVKQ